MRKQALGNMSLAEARERLLLSFRFSPQTERVPVPQARGRVTAEPVYARLSMPPFPAAAMDGIAVRADRTRDASPARPLRLEEGWTAIPSTPGIPSRRGWMR